MYLLLTRSLCRLDPLVALDEALVAGVDLVQVREPADSDRKLLEWVHDVRERCAAHRVPVIVNDRVDVALLAGAEGVHVGQDDLPPRAIRELVGDRLLIGLSTHGLAQVTEAQQEPVDYIGMGPVFDTETKDLLGQGPPWLESLVAHVTLPAFAIGGIDLGNVADVRAAGQRRIAISSAICGADDPAAVVHGLMRILDEEDAADG